MDLIGEERGRLARAATWLQASRAELVGLAVLLSGALALTGVVTWSALDRPASVAGTAGGGAPHPADVGDAGVGEPGDHAGTDGPGDAPAPADGHVWGEGADQGPAPTGEVVVHVSGAVATGGIVTLPAGARVADAVAAAGGTVDGADLAGINLARPLADGEHVHVPREGETPPPTAEGPGSPGGAGAGPGGGSGTAVDLNRADATELQTLPGIGPALAQRIITHREQHGPFREVGELRDVSGIGEKRFQELAPLVTVG